LVRFLIEQIEVSVQGETDQVEVAIRWHLLAPDTLHFTGWARGRMLSG
jgi:hypothetical protein